VFNGVNNESFEIIKSIINSSTFYDLQKIVLTFANGANIYFIESKIHKILCFTMQNFGCYNILS